MSGSQTRPREIQTGKQRRSTYFPSVNPMNLFLLVSRKCSMSFSLEGTQAGCGLSFCFSFFCFFINIKNTSLRNATRENGAKQTQHTHIRARESHQPRRRSRGLPANRHLICSGGLSSGKQTSAERSRGRQSRFGLIAEATLNAWTCTSRECVLHFYRITCARFVQLPLLIRTCRLKCFTCCSFVLYYEDVWLFAWFLVSIATFVISSMSMRQIQFLNYLEYSACL